MGFRYCRSNFNFSLFESDGSKLRRKRELTDRIHSTQVNCICPGYIKTPLSEALVQQFPEMEQYIIDRTPAGRWGKPADLRGAVLFLASPASDYVTGTSIVVDGGMMFR
jgi:2-deoxy-D-gluconate 3-dehydrogenase